ncbi:MAG: pyridine nucleotide-disulfide oxidoreductase, partial [Actinomycetota bacterium]|nr:pyridine nucleotide-disulfide oxidoreductase [Actinomycetota bacterium]
RIALQNALFPVKSKTDFSTLPWTTFTDPEVARVGLTEAEAREKHDHVEVYTHDLPDLDRAIVDGEGNGFVKIVTGKRGRILGGHVVAPDAGDVIAEVVLAMRKDLSITDLSRTVHVYPTIAEGVKGAADSYYRKKLFGGNARKALGAYFTLRRLVDTQRRGRSKP